MATIRDYQTTGQYRTDGGWIAIVHVIDKTKVSYGVIPTLAEVRAATGDSSIIGIDIQGCFWNCTNMVTAPDIPDNVYGELASTFHGCTSLTSAPRLPSVKGLSSTFEGCTALIDPPAIPSTVTSMIMAFYGCTSLTSAPTIPDGVTSLSRAFDGCTSLTTGANIPSTVTSMYKMYHDCTSLTGNIDIKTNTASYGDMFLGTTLPITIHGLSPTYLQAIADTSPLGNITIDAVAEWLGAVTDRANANTRTTANDMQRIVADMAYLGGVPVKLVYTPNDIVTETEWAAIIAFAQSLDPTITDSTRYDNLNKIEQAFLDAYGG